MSPLLDDGRREREELTAVWDLAGCDPPQSFPRALPKGGHRPLSLHLPLHVARQLCWGIREQPPKVGSSKGNWVVYLSNERVGYVQVKEAGRGVCKFFNYYYAPFKRVPLV